MTTLMRFLCAVTSLLSQEPSPPSVPTTWDAPAMSGWAIPLAALKAPPTEISSRQYYSQPIENLGTYPVYFPGHEPPGYWEMLHKVGPQPLIEPRNLRSEQDWVRAGKTVFEQLDHPHLRTFDPDLIAAARSPESFRGKTPLPDGTVSDIRWVPTARGVALGFRNCSACHIAYLPAGPVPGAPTSFPNRHSSTLINRAHDRLRVVNGSAPFFMGPEPFGIWLYRAWGVPWIPDDIHQQLKSISREDYAALRRSFTRSGAIPRWNGSIFHPAKTPDLIGFRDRKYIDHTATHLHRGIADLMRYAALVSFAETTTFAHYDLLGETAKRAEARVPDEALYALALYIYSLQPPPNPHPLDETAKAGEAVFHREGCNRCHPPPLYTNNKVTLAQGFSLPEPLPAGLDVLPFSVGTDAALALRTRKGTGFYKVPSLKGLWYRGHYLHDGSVATLEEMFDPHRLDPNHIPGGWKPPAAVAYPIRGHEFGLRLTPTDRARLIAFLRTL